MKAVGQDMQEKAAQELVRAEPHDAVRAASAIVLVAERHLGVGDVDQPGIADGGPMGVAGEIGQHALRSAEGRFGVDDERALAKRAQAFGESGGFGERRKIAEEAEFAAAKAASRPSRNSRRKAFDRARTESRKLGLQPTHRCAVERDAAAGNEAMDMRVVGQRLPPGVQDGDQADLGAQALGGESLSAWAAARISRP